MSNKDVIFVAEDTASLVMVPVKAVTADLVTEAGVTVYVPLATTENPGVVQIGEGLKITDTGLLSVDISDISAGVVIKHNDIEINDNATTVNFTNTFNVSVDPDTLEVKIDGSDVLNRIIENYDDNYVFLLNAFNNYYDKSYIDNIIVDDLETDSAVKALSAKQGVVLKDLVLQVPHARVFDNISAMVSGLNGAGPDAFNVGTTFRLIDLDVPDFWVSGVYDDYQSYEYTTDDVLINAININKKVRIGYYDISKAETEKVVLDDITHEIGELQADVEDLQSQIDDIDLAEYVDRQSVQEISGVKTFVEQIGIKNTDGTTDYIKHINNNLLISTSAGTNLLNIDEGLSKIYAFNRELAFKTDISSAGGTKIYYEGVTDAIDSITFKSNPQTQIDEKISYNVQSLTLEQQAQARANIGAFSIENANEKADISQISNPNLLINGDFRINQRAKTNYSVPGYTVDRWRISSTGGSVSVIENGITFAVSGNTDYLLQDIENGFEILKGKTITMSVGLTDGTILSGTGTVSSTLTAGAILGINRTGFEGTGAFIRSNGVIRVQIGLSTGYSVSVSFIKLEIGNVATTFVPRPYAEELSLCQRYGFIVDGLRRIRASYVWANNIDFAIVLPSNLRTNPTMDFTNFKITTINSASNIQTGFTFSVFNLSGNIIDVRCTKTAHGMADAILEVSNTFIDAEIY